MENDITLLEQAIGIHLDRAFECKDRYLETRNHNDREEYRFNLDMVEELRKRIREIDDER